MPTDAPNPAAPLLRHPGSNLPTTGHKGNDFRPQEGGKGKGVHWRCAVCLAAKAAARTTTNASA